MSSQGDNILRQDIESFDGQVAFGEYSNFSVGENITNYQLQVGSVISSENCKAAGNHYII